MNNVHVLKQPETVTALPPHAPRVLTESFQRRLAALNNVERELRQMGIKTVWTRLAGQLPQAHIQRDHAVSIAPLLNRMGPRSFTPSDGCVIASGEFQGVIVSWAEPKQ